MKEVEQSFRLLDNWIEQNGWAGYDPYDIRGTKLGLFVQKKIHGFYFPCAFKHIFSHAFPETLQGEERDKRKSDGTFCKRLFKSL